MTQGLLRPVTESLQDRVVPGPQPQDEPPPLISWIRFAVATISVGCRVYVTAMPLAIVIRSVACASIRHWPSASYGAGISYGRAICAWPGGMLPPAPWVQ